MKTKAHYLTKMDHYLKANNMKKSIVFLITGMLCLASYGQKITALGEATIVTTGSMTYIRQGSSGDLIKRITIANLLSGRIATTDTAAMLTKYVRKASPTLTGDVTLPAGTSIGNVSATEIDYINNVTSSIQNQLNAKTNNTDTATMLTPYINRADTATMLAKYLLITDASTGDLSAADTTDMLTPYINRADTSAMLADYINKADTAAMLAPYILEADTVQGSSLYHMLTDTIPIFVFGSYGDSTMFNKGSDNFGCFRTKQDSLDVTSLEKLRISSGDTLLFNVYYGNYQTATATDSLFTAPQNSALGSTSDYVPDNLTVIPPEVDVWIGLPADQPAHKPTNFVMQLNGKKIRE